MPRVRPAAATLPEGHHKQGSVSPPAAPLPPSTTFGRPPQCTALEREAATYSARLASDPDRSPSLVRSRIVRQPIPDPQHRDTVRALAEIDDHEGAGDGEAA